MRVSGSGVRIVLRSSAICFSSSVTTKSSTVFGVSAFSSANAIWTDLGCSFGVLFFSCAASCSFWNAMASKSLFCSRIWETSSTCETSSFICSSVGSSFFASSAALSTFVPAGFFGSFGSYSSIFAWGISIWFLRPTILSTSNVVFKPSMSVSISAMSWLFSLRLMSFGSLKERDDMSMISPSSLPSPALLSIFSAAAILSAPRFSSLPFFPLFGSPSSPGFPSSFEFSFSSFSWRFVFIAISIMCWTYSSLFSSPLSGAFL